MSAGQLREVGPSGPSDVIALQTDYRRRHFVAIGVNQYVDYPRLQNAEHDAVGAADLLRQSFGFEGRVLRDAEATKEAISGAIADGLRSVVEPDDLAVIYFAGHGHTESDARAMPHGFIVPVDAHKGRLAELISMRELAQWTGFLRCRHVLYVFDSCFSGLMVNRGEVSESRATMFERRARLALTAGGADQTVVDGGWQNHSIFSGLVLQLLSEGALEDDDGVISATALFQHVSREVPRRCPQTPAMGSLDGHEGGDILLRRTGARQTPLVISPAPPPTGAIGGYSSRLPTAGHTTRSSISSHQDEVLRCHTDGDPAGAGQVTLFSDVASRQWALIIGTKPALALPPDGRLDTEFIDAWDVLDWFVNPDLFGAIPPERVFFLVSDEATSASVTAAMTAITDGCRSSDSVLFFFSGHATEFSRPGELMLFDAFEGGRWGDLRPGDVVPGAIATDALVEWMNELPAEKVVTVADSGGLPLYVSSASLAPGRFVLSSVRSVTLGRNGFVTWYVRRVLQRVGSTATLSQIQRVLVEGGRLVDEAHGWGLHPYLGFSGAGLASRAELYAAP